MDKLVSLALPVPLQDRFRRPEILAPAGDWECLRAAVENGADAVYFGLNSGFNARARAANFEPTDLPAIVEFLHRRGVRGYVTLNTLVFTDELPIVERLIRQIAAAGVDAVLVQDIGIARLVAAVCDQLPVHASTQMTLSSAECIDAVQSLGFERVVLPRELSVNEIAAIHKSSPMALEAFVHGALCVAYSGQCLTSESLGGRSANRGQCAQACRLPYDLICDGRDVDTGAVKYLLSPQDLAAYELIPALIQAGVCSLKIEGRLKTPEYVANITRHYREAVDQAMCGQPVRFTPRQVEEMELSFSRGFSPGWLEGCDHKRLVPGESSSKRGVFLGSVLEIRRGRVQVRLSRRLKRGDGIVFDCGKPTDDMQGGRVYEIFRDGQSVTGEVANGIVELTFGQDAIDWNEVWQGQSIWKTDDPELTSRLRKTFSSKSPLRRMPVAISVSAKVAEPLRISVRASSGVAFELTSDEPLAEATRHPLSIETLRDQLGRLGGTHYVLGDLQADIDGVPMVPFSVLGKMRHEIVHKLDTMSVVPTRTLPTRPVLPVLRAAMLGNDQAAELPATLSVLCRTLKQLDSALGAGVRELYVDFQDIRQYRNAIERTQSAGGRVFPATPRIQKPGELGIFRALMKWGATGVLVRNLAGLKFFSEQKLPVVADFSLNVTNELTADWIRQQGATRITASYDLNREQLLDLAAAVPPSWLEVVIHQHMPMFHMEHCVYCAVLSPGTNKTNCGRPCDEHDVKLRDRLGMEHPLRADVGCRNTLFNSVPQSAAEVVPQLLPLGLKNFRVELLHDDDAGIRRTIELYQRLLKGEISGKSVWSALKATNRVGVTRGTLEERRNPLAIL